MQLPPPFHGASYMNSMIANSKLLNNFFALKINYQKLILLQKILYNLGYNFFYYKKYKQL